MKKYLPWIAAIGFTASLIVVIPAAFAQTNGSGGWGGNRGIGMMRGNPAWLTASGAPGVFGTVSSVSGNTLMVAQKLRPNATTTPVTYTVDATNAQVYKNGATSTIASVVAGDTVIIQGTVAGTAVVATVIRDGVMMGGRGAPGMLGKRGFGTRENSSSNPRASAIQGSGQPVIGGNISAISGTTLTVTNASNITYAVDALSAKFIKNGTSSPLTSAVVGDRVIVQGTVNGTSITASSIIDYGSETSSSAQTRAPPISVNFGFFGAIGNFFKHLFGF
jgi:hypothetical protein